MPPSMKQSNNSVRSGNFLKLASSLCLIFMIIVIRAVDYYWHFWSDPRAMIFESLAKSRRMGHRGNRSWTGLDLHIFDLRKEAVAKRVSSIGEGAGRGSKSKVSAHALTERSGQKAPRNNFAAPLSVDWRWWRALPPSQVNGRSIHLNAHLSATYKMTVMQLVMAVWPMVNAGPSVAKCWQQM